MKDKSTKVNLKNMSIQVPEELAKKTKEVSKNNDVSKLNLQQFLTKLSE